MRRAAALPLSQVAALGGPQPCGSVTSAAVLHAHTLGCPRELVAPPTRAEVGCRPQDPHTKGAAAESTQLCSAAEAATLSQTRQWEDGLETGAQARSNTAPSAEDKAIREQARARHSGIVHRVWATWQYGRTCRSACTKAALRNTQVRDAADGCRVMSLSSASKHSAAKVPAASLCRRLHVKRRDRANGSGAEAGRCCNRRRPAKRAARQRGKRRGPPAKAAGQKRDRSADVQAELRSRGEAGAARR